ncbi:DUF4265 domain-containing protein [Streptomyces sp. NPDC059479]|uniref:DUF4265 domain-containing protein n=1 Tax=Streptomyces sp. NPDC059479 TaxID=3346848 RepID=UPI00369AD0B5
MPGSAEPTSPGHAGRADAVRLLVETGPSGRPVFENVPARDLGEGRWRLLASPGLATGAAAGDTLAVAGDGGFTVTGRAGNVAVHVSAPASAEERLGELTVQVKALGGWLDGRSHTRDAAYSFSVYTVPVKAGFPAIEEAFQSYAADVPDGQWTYANVFADAEGSRPLNWWLG